VRKTKTDSIRGWAKIEPSNVNALGEFEGPELVLNAFLCDAIPLQHVGATGVLGIARRMAALKTAVFTVPRAALKRALPKWTSKRLDLGQWYQIQLSPGHRSRYPHLSNLSGLEGAWHLSQVEPIEPRKRRKLERTVQKMFDACVCSGADLNQFLSKVDATISDDSPDVCVVDVGQASLSIVYRSARPLLYFDLGWPLSFNASTRPQALPDLPDRKAPVLLSHWDWDHWAFALETWKKGKPLWKATACCREWLVPGVGPAWGNVVPTPTALKLAAHLFALKKLKVWDSSVRGVTQGHLTIARVDTSVVASAFDADPNQNGLFLMVHSPVEPDPVTGPNAQRPRIEPVRALLLAGDADYQFIELGLGVKFDRFDWRGLNATHHGGRFTEGCVPSAPERSSKSAPASCLAYSCGSTRYGHPKLAAQLAYLGADWRQQVLTQNRVHLSNAKGQQDSRGSVQLSLSDDRDLSTFSDHDWGPRQ